MPFKHCHTPEFTWYGEVYISDLHAATSLHDLKLNIHHSFAKAGKVVKCPTNA